MLLYLRILLRLSFRGLNSQMRTSLSVHFTYGMNEVGGQTCVVECRSEWRSTLRTLIFFFQHYCDQCLEFHHVIFRFFFFIGYTCIFVFFLLCAQIVQFYHPLCLWNAVSCMLQLSCYCSAVVCVHCSYTVFLLVTGVRVPGPIIFLSLLFVCCVLVYVF